MRISDWSSDVCSSDLTPRSFMTVTSRRVDKCLAVVESQTTDIHRSGSRARWRCATAHSSMCMTTPYPSRMQIGRASGRDRVCQYVLFSVVAVSLKKNRSQLRCFKLQNYTLELL